MFGMFGVLPIARSISHTASAALLLLLLLLRVMPTAASDAALVVARLLAQRQRVRRPHGARLLVALPREHARQLGEFLARPLAHVAQTLTEHIVRLVQLMVLLLLQVLLQLLLELQLLLFQRVDEFGIPAQLVHELLVLQHLGELLVGHVAQYGVAAGRLVGVRLDSVMEKNGGIEYWRRVQCIDHFVVLNKRLQPGFIGKIQEYL